MLGVVVRIGVPLEVISLVVRGRRRMATFTWEVVMVDGWSLELVSLVVVGFEKENWRRNLQESSFFWLTTFTLALADSKLLLLLPS